MPGRAPGSLLIDRRSYCTTGVALTAAVPLTPERKQLALQAAV